MTNAILLTKYIKDALESDSELRRLVSQYKDQNTGALKSMSPRIFPLVTERDTLFPFIIIERNNLFPFTTKDGTYNDKVSVLINVVSDRYEESLIIANNVRNLIENNKYRKKGEIYVESIRLESVTEYYEELAYVQQMNFEFTCANFVKI